MKSTVLVAAALILAGTVALGSTTGCNNPANEEEGKYRQADVPLQPEYSSPTDESIIFVRVLKTSVDAQNSLFIMDHIGASPELLLDKRLLIDASKSPDGNRIAFRKEGDIKIYHINTGDEKRIDYRGNYSWAPDGKSIYILGRESSEIVEQPIQVQLFRYDLESENAELLDIDAQENGKGVEGEITVSPSGTRIIFCDTRGSYFHCGDIYERSVRNLREIATDVGATYTTDLVWLNDEEVVYVERFRSDTGPYGWNSRLVKVDVDSSEKTTILESDWSSNFVLGYWTRSFFPLACSPDGKMIIVPVLDDPIKAEESEMPLASLYIVNADGSDLTRLTDPGGEGGKYGDYWVSWAAR